MGTVPVLGIVVLVVGIILIGVEFYMPGFGIPGIFGIIFTAAGIYLTGDNTYDRVLIGVIAIVIIAVMLVISIIVFNSKKVRSPIKLDTDLEGKDLFEAAKFANAVSGYKISGHEIDKDAVTAFMKKTALRSNE